VFGLLELEIPIICGLNGAAAGLGATIALLCDDRIGAGTNDTGISLTRLTFETTLSLS
jgi:enoyl-CoA hydratase